MISIFLKLGWRLNFPWTQHSGQLQLVSSTGALRQIMEVWWIMEGGRVRDGEGAAHGVIIWKLEPNLCDIQLGINVLKVEKRCVFN